MKTIGMIGGMSWESTQEYYRLLNEGIKSRLGGLHSSRLLLYSVDFHEIEVLQHRDDWEALTNLLKDIASRLENAGADLLMICTNTMHLMADEVEASVGIPLLHIADAAAASIRKAGIEKIGLLGTRFTMEQDFYRGRLSERHGIEVLVPGNDDMDLIHGVIYNELCRGRLEDDSRREFVRIIDGLAESGAQGVVLGCTEIPLLIRQKDVGIPVFNTMQLHAEAAIDAALSGL